MLPEWSAVLVAKAKVAALLGAVLAAGGVGGAVALSHVAPTTQVVTTTASTTDPQPTATVDPESTQVGTPTQAADPTATTDPESSQAGTPTTGTYTLPTCPSDVKNHGAYVSSVAKSAPKGPGGVHGQWVSQAAQSDCGKSPSTSSTDQQSSSADSSTDPESSDATDTTDTQSSTGDSAPTSTTHGPSSDHTSHGSSGTHGNGHSKH